MVTTVNVNDVKIKKLKGELRAIHSEINELTKKTVLLLKRKVDIQQTLRCEQLLAEKIKKLLL